MILPADPKPLRARFGPYRLDEAEALLARGDQPVDLPPRAFQVLCALVRRPGQLVTKDALLDAVWGHRHVNESALKNIVSQLRQALGDDAQQSRFIQTAARRGYRFIEPVIDEHGSAGPAPSAPAIPAPTVAPTVAPPPATTALPEAGSGGTLVGRAVPLAQLQAALAAARQGQRQLVFVLGEAGVGKSALVERFTAGCGARLAFGQCIEHYGISEPYMPVLDALNALCRAEGGAAVIDAMRAVAPTWLLQLPWFVGENDRRNLQREAAGATQDRMLREFGELADRIARDAPLVLVLEDLHWSDGATVQLLGYLARRRVPAALMVLGTFRPAELILEDHPLARLRLELRRHRLSREVELDPLSETDIAEWLAARLGAPAPVAFVQLLHDQASGVPLFLTSLVDELIASGALRRTDAGWELPTAEALAAPRSIVDVIESQLSRLSPQQQLAVEAASVGGVEFQDVPLAQVLQLDMPALQALLSQAAVRLPWLRSAGADALPGGAIAARHAFTHAMCRQVVYDRIPPAQRLQWHRAWAEALAALHGPAAGAIASELALHLERGEAPIAAAGQLAIVASRALARGAPEEALHAVRRGLQLGAGRLDPALEIELRVGEAVALSRLQIVTAPDVAAAFDRARALGPCDCAAWPRALHGAWWVHFARGEFDEARELAAQMLALAQRTDDVGMQITALTAAAHSDSMAGDLTRACQRFEAALRLHESAGALLPPTQFVQDPGVEANSGLALACWVTGEPARARVLAERAIGMASGSGHPVGLVTALTAAAILHSYAGEFDVVGALAGRVERLIGRESLPPVHGDHAWLHGRARVAAGQLNEGLAQMRSAGRGAEEIGMRLGLCGFHLLHGAACLEAARHADAHASIEEGLQLAEVPSAQALLAPLLHLRALSREAEGDAGGRDAALCRAVAVARSQGAAFFELEALATALRLGSAAADPARLRELLALYEGDPSPVIVAARAG